MSTAKTERQCDSQMDAGANIGTLRCSLTEGHEGRHECEYREAFEWTDTSDITHRPKPRRRTP